MVKDRIGLFVFIYLHQEALVAGKHLEGEKSFRLIQLSCAEKRIGGGRVNQVYEYMGQFRLAKSALHIKSL